MRWLSPWNKVWRSYKRQRPDLLVERRREWRLATKHLVEKAMQEAQKEFPGFRLNYFHPEENPDFGVKTTNFDIYGLAFPPQPFAIRFEYFHLRRKTGTAIASQIGGSIFFSQASTGQIVVVFNRTYIEMPDSKKQNDYTIITKNDKRHNVTVESKEKKEREGSIVYKCYEPWELNERKIKKAIANGLKFALETGQTAKPGILTRWLSIKDNDIFKGAILGTIFAMLTSGAWEIAKYLLKKIQP